DDLVDREELAISHDGETNAPGDRRAVRHPERYVLLLPLDAERVEHVRGDPSVFTARVDEHLRDGFARGAVHVFDCAIDVKRAHGLPPYIMSSMPPMPPWSWPWLWP